jgi:hypothetical protein
VKYGKNSITIHYEDGSRLVASEKGKRVDFIFYRPEDQIVFVEIKAGHRWTSSEGNNPSRQFGESLRAYQDFELPVGGESYPLPEFLLRSHIGDDARGSLRMQTNAVSRTEPLLAVVVSGSPATIVRYHAIEMRHIAEFLGESTKHRLEDLERIYTAALRENAHRAGNTMIPTLQHDEVVRLLQVGRPM